MKLHVENYNVESCYTLEATNFSRLVGGGEGTPNTHTCMNANATIIIIKKYLLMGICTKCM